MIVRSAVLVIATWAVESAVFRIVLRDRFRIRSAIDLFWVNLLTNPAANYAYGDLGWNWWAVESIVTVVETWAIAKTMRLTIRQAFVLSLLANGVTAAIGRIIESLPA